MKLGFLLLLFKLEGRKLGIQNTMTQRFLYVPCRYMLTILVCFLFINIGMAQSNWIPTRYYGIPDDEKRVEFVDEFKDNRHNWSLSSHNVNITIDDDLYCESQTSQAVSRFQLVPINQMGNYEIELRMRFVRGNSGNATGLTFGRDVRGSAYHFLFMPKGSRYKIYKQDRSGRGEGQNIQSWQTSEQLQHTYAGNTLTVRKVGDQWYFFINQELVTQKPAQRLYGSDFGFRIGGNMSIEVDYLKVSEIRTIDKEGPILSLLQPRLNGSQMMSFDESKQIIKGQVSDASGISEVLINDTPISIDTEGTFTASVVLPHGPTRIEIVARDAYRNMTRESFYMQYYPEPPREEISSINYYEGKNYLLLIGVNEYDYWTNLHNAVKDCSDLEKELTSHYQFEEENVTSLLNEKATRENILEAFEDLQEKITDKDNLLIYYAGHGYYDNQSTRGYWVPSDARLSKIADFIRNSTIHDYIKSIDSHHTFLIADACYAGSLFSESRGVINEKARSRWAFTSGDIEKVWDGQPGQNSPFARYLLRSLHENRSSRLRADRLIEEVKEVVKRNTAQTPIGNALQNVGDEGGIFFFVRRNSRRR